jgi:hypothetical protein
MSDKHIEAEESRDLCLTCKYQSSCVYLKNREGPILYCEEFEIQPYPEGNQASKPAESKPGEEHPVYGGLCKNCGHLETCMNASPDRIIWHCEEYI